MRNKLIFDETRRLKLSDDISAMIPSAADTLIELARTVPFFQSPSGNESLRTIRDNAEEIVHLLAKEPEAVTRKGRTVMYLRTSLPGKIDSLGISISSDCRSALQEELENDITTDLLREAGHGNYNTVCRMYLKKTTLPKPLAVRISNHEAYDYRKTVPYPFSIQMETQESIRSAMITAERDGTYGPLAKVPTCFYTGDGDDYQVMEFIENSLWLERAPFELKKGHFESIRVSVRENLAIR